VSLLDDFSKIVAAGPAFFVSAWLPVIFAGIADAEVGMTTSKPQRAWRNACRLGRGP
jgi:hypothetical protein